MTALPLPLPLIFTYNGTSLVSSSELSSPPTIPPNVPSGMIPNASDMVFLLGVVLEAEEAEEVSVCGNAVLR